jgi:transaldolase / glucose-6-phosphate isomerase
MHVHPGSLGPAFTAGGHMARGIVERIWARDHTVWQHDPAEVADRLGWLDCPVAFRERAGEYQALADAVRADGIEHVLLVGMGGSSLYPEVLARAVSPGDGVVLHVLDTTHPAAVQRYRDRFDPDRWLLVAASKSGTTIETRSHLARFWEDLVAAHGPDRAGRHVIAITDPGSELAALGRDRGFRAVVENPPDIGGRFSALSAFGLVPAALLGIDVQRHLAPAAAMAEAAADLDLDVNEPARLGVALGEAALAGRTQMTLLLPDELAPFGAWVEQLVAESTGKHGVGLLPVLDEPVLPADQYGDKRLVVAVGDHPGLEAVVAAGVPVVRLPAVAPEDIAGEVFRWEFATAVCGALLGINPFDQPDVQAAKSATGRVLAEGGAPLVPTSAADLLAEVSAGDHVCLLAYVDPEGETAGRLGDVAADLRARLRVPVTVGIGPRYLHSTGQFHKGGPDDGVHVLLFENSDVDVPVPGENFTFGELVAAQAAGDLAALRERGRRVGHVTLDALASAAT